jgi:hypothetical protein
MRERVTAEARPWLAPVVPGRAFVSRVKGEVAVAGAPTVSELTDDQRLGPLHDVMSVPVAHAESLVTR